ncbi:phytanoyl-CoA dioxygenase family protein [Leifsonia kafniensis]|uniref:Phytanoyl-CoA dioxygenase family protein n=1 Tax=Leifsonia kafniensis TaxID=475957 RepID=A0ABP7K1H8_9MICO
MLTSNGYTLDSSEKRLGWLEPVPDADRTKRDVLWERLRRDGYLYLPQQLQADLVNGFREYYFSTMAETGIIAPGTHPADGIGRAACADREKVHGVLFGDIVPGVRYEELTTHPDVKGWFQWFLGDDVHLHKRKIIRHLMPGETGIGTATQAHYDLVYLREGSERVLSMWIPLGDCPPEMGGLTYLEGSHHWALADERERGNRRPAASITADLPGLAEKHDSRWLLADFAAGDVVVHSSYVVHASTDNVDALGRIRLSTDIRYQRASEPIDWRWQEHWHEDDGL